MDWKLLAKHDATTFLLFFSQEQSILDWLEFSRFTGYVAMFYRILQNDIRTDSIQKYGDNRQLKCAIRFDRFSLQGQIFFFGTISSISSLFRFFDVKSTSSNEVLTLELKVEAKKKNV